LRSIASYIKIWEAGGEKKGGVAKGQYIQGGGGSVGKTDRMKLLSLGVTAVEGEVAAACLKKEEGENGTEHGKAFAGSGN